MMTPILAAAVLAFTTPEPVPTAAATPTGAPEWRAEELFREKDGRPVSLGVALYTTDFTRPGVIFLCSNGAISAAVSMEPADLREAVINSGPLEAVDVKHRIGDDEEARTPFVLATRHGLFLASDKKLSKRLYNAMVRNEDVMLNPTTRKPMTMTFPAPAPEAFAAFRAECQKSE